MSRAARAWFAAAFVLAGAEPAVHLWAVAPLPVVVGAGLYAGAVAAWVRRPGRWPAAVAFAALAAGAAAEVGVVGLHHAKYGPALLLLAWAIAGPAQAEDAGAGAMGACYTWAGLSKLLAGGTAWVDGTTLAVLVAERADGPVRSWLAGQPTLCAVGGALALTLELSGFVYLPRRTRPWFAGAAAVMHTSFGVVLGYSYLPWVCIDVAYVVLAWGRRQSRNTPKPSGPSRSGPWAMAASESPSTLRVRAGSMMPSSQRLAVE